MRSGKAAAMVLGATSAKIKKMKVQITGAQTTPLSPRISIASSVAMDAAEKLTKLLPIRMTPRRRSGLSNSWAALCAPR